MQVVTVVPRCVKCQTRRVLNPRKLLTLKESRAGARKLKKAGGSNIYFHALWRMVDVRAAELGQIMRSPVHFLENTFGLFVLAYSLPWVLGASRG